MLKHPDTLSGSNATAPADASASEDWTAAANLVAASTRKKRSKSANNNADAASAKPPREKKSESKADAVLKWLRSARGVSVQQLVEATGWQAHSVRGFLSGVVRKKLGLTLISEAGKEGVRRYRIDDATSTKDVRTDDAGAGEASE